jgi:hypothetical protein
MTNNNKLPKYMEKAAKFCLRVCIKKISGDYDKAFPGQIILRPFE